MDKFGSIIGGIKMHNGKTYIYDILCADFFMSKGLRCLSTGYNAKRQKIYWTFDYEDCLKFFEEWKIIVEERKRNKK